MLLDNGAFSTWRKSGGEETDWPKWAAWAERWCEYRTTWAVLPDSIDGGVERNDELLVEWRNVVPRAQAAPVWHLHEPLGRLVDLCSDYDRVCFGSSGLYRNPGSPSWHRRVSDAFDAIADEHGRVPWIHMLRGMKFAGSHYPFSSADSTDIARNHQREHNTAAEMAARWDALQCPPRWVGSEQQ